MSFQLEAADLFSTISWFFGIQADPFDPNYTVKFLTRSSHSCPNAMSELQHVWDSFLPNSVCKTSLIKSILLHQWEVEQRLENNRMFEQENSTVLI